MTTIKFLFYHPNTLSNQDCNSNNFMNYKKQHQFFTKYKIVKNFICESEVILINFSKKDIVDNYWTK